MIGGCILHAAVGWVLRAILGGDLPTEDELAAIIADHPLMQDR